ncbi:hypothetical protein I7I50_02298 [Histoplasma capsulatum G186AR]|uniref:Uncharacterized protein n=1 Tax=Ajellomyces capsulatus TaxID=5037 RepID=A0A8H8D6Z8_AJECA|nr:hypothetical protein I7I52_01038 [Histoplasma capsulatum]QSS71461.1 hypothetical protein I7I50_02298 [Histoplasma capsulatum G186AR]
MILLPSHCFLLSERMNGSFPSLLYFFLSISALSKTDYHVLPERASISSSASKDFVMMPGGLPLVYRSLGGRKDVSSSQHYSAESMPQASNL